MTRPSDLAASDAWQAEHVRFAPNRYAARRTVERCQNRSLFCAIAWQNRSTPKFQLRKNRHCSRNADSRLERTPVSLALDSAPSPPLSRRASRTHTT
jgi:hypothetical protein